MKFILAMITCFIVLTGTIQAQQKFFLAEDGSMTDSAKAKYYLIRTKVSDTLWTGKQYNMLNEIVTIGNYRDASLSIPNGRFFYYKEIDRTPILKSESIAIRQLKELNRKSDTFVYVKQAGTFHNGKKTGVWIDYNKSGQKVYEYNYKDDKLNGQYLFYGIYTDFPEIEGSYIDDIREGTWLTRSATGTVFREEHYLHGKVVSSVVAPSDFVSAVPPEQLADYIETKLSKTTTLKTNGRYAVTGTVTKSGKLIKIGVLVMGAEDVTVKNELIKLLENSNMLWAPPFDKKLNQVVEDQVNFAVEIKSGKVKFEYSPRGNEVYHQIMH